MVDVVIISGKRNTNSTNPRERKINGKTRSKTVQHTQQTLIDSNQPLYLDEVENLQTLKTVHPTITVAESQGKAMEEEKKIVEGTKRKEKKKGGAGAKVFLFFFFGSPRTKTKTERKRKFLDCVLNEIGNISHLKMKKKSP